MQKFGIWIKKKPCKADCKNVVLKCYKLCFQCQRAKAQNKIMHDKFCPHEFWLKVSFCALSTAPNVKWESSLFKLLPGCLETDRGVNKVLSVFHGVRYAHISCENHKLDTQWIVADGQIDSAFYSLISDTSSRWH